MFIRRFAGALLKEKALLLFLLRIPRDGQTHTHTCTCAPNISLICLHAYGFEKKMTSLKGWPSKATISKSEKGKTYYFASFDISAVRRDTLMAGNPFPAASAEQSAVEP